MKFQIFKGGDGEFRWILLSKDNKAIAVGGPYKRKGYCHLAIALVQSCADAEIEDMTLEDK